MRGAFGGSARPGSCVRSCAGLRPRYWARGEGVAVRACVVGVGWGSSGVRRCTWVCNVYRVCGAEAGSWCGERG